MSAKKIIQFSLITLFLLLIIKYFAHHKDEFYMLKNIRLKSIIQLFVISLVINIAYAINILLVLKKIGLKSIGYLDWFKIYVIARYLNLHITQGKSLYLGYKLKKDYGFSYTKSISTITFLTWFYSFTTLFLCCLLIGLKSNSALAKDQYFFLILMLITLATFLAPFLFRIIFTRFNFKQRPLKWLEEKINDLLSEFHKSAKDPKLILATTSLIAFQFALYLLLISIGFQALNLHLELSELSLFTVLLMVSKFINIVPGNIGVTEYLCGTLSESITGRLGDGIIMSGILRVVDYVLITILGILFAKTFFTKIQYKDSEAIEN